MSSARRPSLVAQQHGKGGFIVQRDAEIAKNEPGTHNGGGQTIGYSFFDKTPGMKFVFRKRALHPGAGVGSTSSTRTRCITSSAAKA